jgi:hypothetical protein
MKELKVNDKHFKVNIYHSKHRKIASALTTDTHPYRIYKGMFSKKADDNTIIKQIKIYLKNNL